MKSSLEQYNKERDFKGLFQTGHMNIEIDFKNIIYKKYNKKFDSNAEKKNNTSFY